jgi:hypothetical protein
MSLVGLSACSLAAEPAYYRQIPALDAPSAREDSAAPIDAQSIDVASIDVGSIDVASIDASMADAVVAIDQGPPTDTPTLDVPVIGRDVPSSDVPDADPSNLFRPCMNDSACLAGTRCCSQLRNCLPTAIYSAVCDSASRPCGANLCRPGTLCCEGLTSPRCVAIESYINACPNRVCDTRLPYPIDCPRDMTCCNNRCALTRVNVDHCGRCGSSCGSSEACMMGACMLCVQRTETDPNVADVRCCRPGGARACVPIPRL